VTRRDGVVRGLRRGPGAAALALAGLVALAACGGGGGTTAGATAGQPRATASAGSAAAAAPDAGIPHGPRPNGPPLAPAPPPPSALPVAPGAGSLRQTNAFPGTTTTAFRNAIADLWLAVTTGDPSLALPAFFPEAAYVQVKAIADPQADWRSRLWGEFTLDVAAAHALVGRDATFVRVIVPDEYAAWVDPGACYNSIGYWHVPGSRVVYEEGGETRSFGIASLISWRGEWYVVHFGAVLRAGTGGEVDDPAAGPGAPGPPGGC
jgi:hypothetical protein